LLYGQGGCTVQHFRRFTYENLVTTFARFKQQRLKGF
uniref:LysR family transcriptional regulator n=1 Tax=Strongyloides venezuelensis TaxID=75913 RepID=A0A0K0FJY6_STRVS